MRINYTGLPVLISGSPVCLSFWVVVSSGVYTAATQVAVFMHVKPVF